MSLFIRDGKLLEAAELNVEKSSALASDSRREVMSLLAENPSYPAEVARELDISKQSAHYHFKKLEDSGLIDSVGTEERSGGTATIYSVKDDCYVFDPGKEGREIFYPEKREEVEEFLRPLVKRGELDGFIVVGSPERHGPDQVQARDGHLAAEIGMKLGGIARKNEGAVKLDTEVKRQQEFGNSMILVGGVLTNTVTKKFNEEFPAYFSGESFPYRELTTPEETYSEGEIGVISRIQHPEESDKAIFMVAGIRNSGTEAAVRAFKNLEKHIQDYRSNSFYRVVRGLDMNGDGEIDDYEVIE